MQFNTLIFLNIFILYNIYKLVVGNPIVGFRVQDAREYEYSFVVALLDLDPNCTVQENLFCSGSLLTKSHVLTADHCMDRDQDIPFRIHAGSNNITCTRPYVPLNWISYEQWANRENLEIEFPENDITIIKIVRNVRHETPTATLSPIANYQELYGKVATLLGFGEVNNDIIPQILKKANVNIMTNAACTQEISRLKREQVVVPEIQYFCSQDFPYIHIGDGDSGGPLMYENHLIAINKALCPDIDFSPYQVNAFLYINIYRAYIAANIVT